MRKRRQREKRESTKQRERMEPAKEGGEWGGGAAVSPEAFYLSFDNDNL